jgi:hypothetical protein
MLVHPRREPNPAHLISIVQIPDFRQFFPDALPDNAAFAFNILDFHFIFYISRLSLLILQVSHAENPIHITGPV